MKLKIIRTKCQNQPKKFLKSQIKLNMHFTIYSLYHNLAVVCSESMLVVLQIKYYILRVLTTKKPTNWH